MEDIKRQEIKSVIIAEWDNYPTKIDLGRNIEEGFIFGKYANSEHYSLTEIMDIVLEVEAEKNPAVAEEVIVEEPIIEEIPNEVIEPELPLFEDDGN